MTNQSEAECGVFSRILITKKNKKKLTVLYDSVIHDKPDNNDFSCILKIHVFLLYF